jgi:hypothetical protein
LRNVLAFQLSREILAGSWRFNTYFGRDTLMALMLLAPALRPDAIGSGIGSVLERLGPNGEVAHEEDIAELAVLRNAKEGRAASPRRSTTMGWSTTTSCSRLWRRAGCSTAVCRDAARPRFSRAASPLNGHGRSARAQLNGS